jgi:hypothetical protein
VGDVASVINIINVYGAFVDTENSNGGELFCNNPPIAIDDINNTPQDEPASGNVLTNDEDPERDNLVVNTTPVDGPDNGSVVLNPDGSYTYTPDPGFSGEDQFTYEVCDDGTPPLCDTATVYIEVIPNPDGNNRPPIANPDANQTEENTPVSGDLLSNDSDPDGDNLIINTTPVSNPSNGSVTINPDGTYTYTPDPGFTGQDVFSYEVCDDGTPSLCDVAVVVIDVLPDGGNSTFAHDDASVTNQDTPVSGNVSDNDFDPEGDDQTVNTMPILGPANGTVVLNADGSYTYTPDPGFVGNDFFIYETCDDGAPAVCDEATVYIAILPHNDPPVAISDINNTPQDEPASGNVLTNDSDPNGDNLTVNTTPLDSPDNGMLVLNPDGSYVYTPDPGFTGEDQFTYEVCDDGSPPLCDTAIVYIQVVPNPDGNNRPPIANPDANQTEQDTPVDGDLLSNDSDPDGDDLVINTTPVTDPSNGTVVINPDGTYTYTPDPGFTGQDVFTYEVCDNGSPTLCDTTVVVIDVLPDIGNNTFAHDDAAVTDEDTPVSGNVSDNDFDPEGHNQTVNTTPVTAPSNGMVVLSADGSYTYTPDPGFVGNDFFTYETCDDGTPQACDIATVSIAVLVHNNPPLAVDDINNTPQDEPANGNVLTNDSDPDGDDLILNTTPLDGPDNGMVVLNPDGSYTYTPDPGFSGEDQFTYEVCDDGTPSLCDTATVYIEVIPEANGENRPPIANPDANQTEEDTPVNGDLLANDSDPDGDNLIISTTPISNPDNGTVIINGDGTYTYTPDNGFIGQDVFVYEVCDDGTPTLCDSTIVVIDVLPDGGINTDENNTFAHDDAFVTDADVPVSGNVSDNDFDPEGDNQTVNTTPVTAPSNGNVVLAADGSFTYTPDPGFVGNDFFTYETCDDGVPQVCDVATVSIAILPHNDPPVAVDDEATTDEDMSVEIDVLENDSDPDSPLGPPQDVTDPPNGTTTVNPDSTITYTPDPDFVGVDSFTYVICDDATPSLCDTATVVVNVIPQIDTVIVTIPEDSMVTFCADSLTNFGGPAASIEVCDPPSNGGTSISGTCLTYTPAADWSGVDTMCALSCNGDDVCDTTIIIVNVVCPTVAIQVFLEGPYDTVAQNEMFTTLNYYHVLPGQDPDLSENMGAQLLGVAAPPGQPYNTAPWNWSGTEGDDYGDGAGDIPYPETVVDWVLVSVRETDSLAANEVWKCAGLLHSDGTVEFPEQCECAHPLQNGNDYYIVVEHRNHLPIMSYKQIMTGNVLSHDFTQSDSWIYEFMNIPLGSGQKEIDGTYMMFAGNSEQLSARVDINSSDDAQWIEDNSAIFTYVLGDHNLNGDTNATDEFIWIINNSTFTLLPF